MNRAACWPLRLLEVSFRFYERCLDGYQAFVDACSAAFGLVFRLLAAMQDGASRRLV
jgi:hypothetical protein